MPKITVRKCPITKKVFFGDDEYATHIINLRQRMNLERIHMRSRKEAQSLVWHYIDKEISTINELQEFVQKHLHDIFIAFNGGRPEVDEAVRKSSLPMFRLDLKYDEYVGNMFECPRDGVKNYGKGSGKPQHYPGFKGKVTYQLENNPDSDDAMYNDKLRTCMGLTDALGYIGIHTGSGGGSNTHVYEVTMFQDDFPAIRRSIFKAKLRDEDVDAATMMPF